MSLALMIVAILALLLLSAFFSGSETALTAMSRSAVHRLASEGHIRAIAVAGLTANRERLIGGILLGNNLVNIMASALATSLLITFFGDKGVIYATLIMTTMVLIFAEVLPKSYAIARSDEMALAVAPAIRVFIKLFGPIVAVVERIVRMTLHIFGIDLSETRGVLSGSEKIRGAIDLQAHEGGIVKHERYMLGSILDLEELLIEEVMIHRKNMEMIDIELPPQQLLDQIVRSPHTRLPVWQGNPDNIVGILHVKDILRMMRRTNFDIKRFNPRRILRKPWFVPDTTTLSEQLNSFRARREHFAMVVDEYGALQGLITLEDILEEIVGDIEDEYDTATEGIRVEADGSVLCDGTVTIRDLNRQFDWQLPDEEASTIAGLLLFESGMIPAVGQEFDFHGFHFEVLGRRRNQITKLRIVPEAEAADDEDIDD